MFRPRLAEIQRLQRGPKVLQEAGIVLCLMKAFFLGVSECCPFGRSENFTASTAKPGKARVLDALFASLLSSLVQSIFSGHRRILESDSESLSRCPHEPVHGLSFCDAQKVRGFPEKFQLALANPLRR